MKPVKNTLVTALALFSAVLTVVAWKYYWKAAELEAAAVGGDDMAALRRQLAEAEKRRRELESISASRMAAQDSTTEGPRRERGPAGEGNQGRGRGGRGGPGGPGGAEFQAAMERPEMQRLMALQQKAALDGRYGALFKTLNLGGDKLATFKNLLAEKEATMGDVMRVAREQGLDPRSDPAAFQKLMATTQTDTDNAIKAAIGDAAFAQYEQYQATQPQRNVVNQLEQSLSYTSEPLTTAQAEQLVQLMAANSSRAGAGATAPVPPDGGGRGPGGGGGPGGTGGQAQITPTTLAQAQTVLSTTQLQALQDLATLQQAQRAAQQAMRATGAGGQAATGATTRGTGGE